MSRHHDNAPETSPFIVAISHKNANKLHPPTPSVTLVCRKASKWRELWKEVALIDRCVETRLDFSPLCVHAKLKVFFSLARAHIRDVDTNGRSHYGCWVEYGGCHIFSENEHSTRRCWCWNKQAKQTRTMNDWDTSLQCMSVTCIAR